MWIPLDDEGMRDYLAGYVAPLDTRDTEHGVEAWMPHRFYTTRLAGNRVCALCGLLPLDYDSIEIDCESE